MDLNAKLAARRRELAENERNEHLAHQTELEETVVQRLEELGVGTPPGAVDKHDDPEVNKFLEAKLNKLAESRKTDGENVMTAVFFLLAIAAFFFAWWLGLILLFIAIVYTSSLTEKYKKELLAEGAPNKFMG